MKKFFNSVLITVLVLAAAFVVMAPGGGNSGAIWTTNGGCGAQDVNHYDDGDHVWINGSGFDPNTQYTWEITGQPGGASSDPNQTVASGNVTTDGNGDFCFDAYEVGSDGDVDDGEYTVDVGNKNDNYRTEAPETEECPDGDFNGDEQGCGEEPEVCEWDDTLPADDPLCVPPTEMCEWDDTLPADSPLCVPPTEECPDGDFNGDEQGCGEEPEVCEWDDTLPADDPLCVPPTEVCQWNPALTPDDPACKPPQICPKGSHMGDEGECVPTRSCRSYIEWLQSYGIFDRLPPKCELAPPETGATDAVLNLWDRIITAPWWPFR